MVGGQAKWNKFDAAPVIGTYTELTRAIAL
jgi:hypothetical protein